MAQEELNIGNRVDDEDVLAALQEQKKGMIKVRETPD